MNILVISDSSSYIGTGHIMRDLVLVKQFKDDNIIFCTRNLPGNINQKIIQNNIQLETANVLEPDNILKLIKKHSIDMVVIDHYEIDFDYEKELKRKSGAKLFVLDDTYEKHYCDILLNHNINAEPKKYKKLVPKNCELRCGAKYTLLRDEFYKEKRKKRKEKNFKKIFIAMGGADHSNINIKILKVLKKFNDLKIELVTTTANKHLPRLSKYCKNKKWINLHVNSTKIAKLMGKSDLAIVTPSVTLNEIYFMKIPFIAIKTAENQKELYRFLKKNRFTVFDSFDSNKLYNKLRSLKNEK